MTLIDVLDRDGNPTGDVKTKLKIHEQGLWHRAVHIWIYNSKEEILLQLRAKDKDSFPGLLDISAAGHVDADETPIEAAVREMGEEVGLLIKPEKLELAAVIKVSQYIPEIKWQNNEIDSVYFYKFDGGMNDFSMTDGEVEKLDFIPINKFESEVNDPELSKKYVPHGNYYRMIIDKIKERLSISGA